MTIWILAIICLAALASAGYSQGAIRVGFSLIGIFAGMLLAVPVSPAVLPLLPFVGIDTPWMQQIVATIVAFYAVGVVFKIGAAFVHRKAEYHFKYHTPDAVRALWERMNRRLGVCLGLINGWVYFLLICLLISVLGYFTSQIGVTENSSATLRLFNTMATDLVSTRMDKAVGGINPAPERYYEISDFLGFVAHNREVIGRFKTYPPFVVLAKKPVFQAMVNDREFEKLVEKEQDPSQILNHPRTQEVLTNSEAMSDLMSVDLKDLTAYLSTGQSPKLQMDSIIGTWVYNWPASLRVARVMEPDMLTSRMMRLRKELPERWAGGLFVAHMDNKAAINLPANIDGTPIPGISNAPTRTSYSGTWRRTGDSYQLTLSPFYKSGYRPQGADATTVNAVAVVTKAKAGRNEQTEVDRLAFKFKDLPAVFDKIPE